MHESNHFGDFGSRIDCCPIISSCRDFCSLCATKLGFLKELSQDWDTSEAPETSVLKLLTRCIQRYVDSSLFSYFSSIFQQYCAKKYKLSSDPYTSGCASTRAFHTWSRICRSSLGLAANSFSVSVFDGQSSCTRSSTNTYVIPQCPGTYLSVADWIDRMETINERCLLLDKETEKLSKHKTVCMVISNNNPKTWERDFILKDGDNPKMLWAVKTILKTIKKAHGKDKVKEKPSDKKLNSHRAKARYMAPSIIGRSTSFLEET